MDVTSYLLGKKSGGGPTPTYQSKEVDITENGTTNITPDTGYDALSRVDVTVSGILDTSDADAVASDMAMDKTAYVNGNKITGNVPVGSSSVATNYSASNVNVYLDDLQVNTEQGNTNQMFRTGDKISVYTPLTDVAPVVGASAEKIKKDEVICGVTGTYEGGGGTPTVEEKDVNFYDYDGTRVYSYTASDFANLSAMPANPTHTGLTAQGWNWSLSDAKTYVADYGELDIGQLYVTDDNTTRVYFDIPTDNFTIYFQMYATSMTVDWGDGTTYSGTGQNASHTYSKGKHKMIISSNSTISFGVPNYYWIFKQQANTYENRAVWAAVEKIEMGNNINLTGKSFYSLSNLKEIVFNCTNTTIPTDTFNSCFHLQCVVFRNTITTLENDAFAASNFARLIFTNGLTTLNARAINNIRFKRITLPTTLTTIGEQCMNSASLKYIKIPASVTTLNNLSFNTNSPSYYDFSKHQSIPTATSSTFTSTTTSSLKIIVPDALYETWKARSGWSTYASYIVKASEA